MKKQIKNKNTARAIAFFLATVVMATSIPMTALAEGENTEEFTLTEENKTSDIKGNARSCGYSFRVR